MKEIVCPAPGCQGYRKHWCDPDTSRGPQIVEVPDDWPEGKPAFCSMTCALYAGYMTLEYVSEENACPQCLAQGIKVKHSKDSKCVEPEIRTDDHGIP